VGEQGTYQSQQCKRLSVEAFWSTSMLRNKIVRRDLSVFPNNVSQLVMTFRTHVVNFEAGLQSDLAHNQFCPTRRLGVFSLATQSSSSEELYLDHYPRAINADTISLPTTCLFLSLFTEWSGTLTFTESVNPKIHPKRSPHQQA
jgi:hypothetical protein